jgi:small subunit ribosomal protein S14
MNYLKNESKIWFLKSIIFDISMPHNDWTKASFILAKKFKRFSKIRIVNRCIITGRAKSVLRDFWLSRMEFKRFSSEGLLTGVKKRNF